MLWICFFSFAEPFSQYTIKLAANTSVGKGPFATRNYSTEEGGIYKLFVSPRSVLLFLVC